MRRWRTRAGAVVLACCLLAGCGGGDGGGGDGMIEYVAIGDSYTAGPVGQQQDESDGCLRSDSNYPSLVARVHETVRLVDVSCAGADTSALDEGQEIAGHPSPPPQLDALTSATDLVTISLGANDDRFALDWLYTCTDLGRSHPGGSPCSRLDSQQQTTMTDRLRQMRVSLQDGIELVLERAPGAEVLVVGYPQIVPPVGYCPDRLPLGVGDYDWARRLNEALRDAVAEAARGTGVELVDVWGMSEGHDICSGDPWFNGASPDLEPALRFHPVQAYHDAVAELVGDRL